MKRSMIDPDRKKALAKMRRKVGGDFGAIRCACCRREFSEDEILAADFVYAVGRSGAVQYCHDCFKKTFFSGGGKSN